MKRLFAGMFLALLWPSAAWADTPREALSKARASLDGLSSYHLRLEDGSEPTEVDYTATQRVRITKPGSVGIIVGAGVYLNVGGAGWTPAAVNTTLAVLLDMLSNDTLLAVTDADEIADRGVAPSGGIEMHAYEIRTPVNGSFLLRTIWVGEKDGLPHRVERGGGTTGLMATYSGFNQDFGIEVPSGAQPAAQR